MWIGAVLAAVLAALFAVPMFIDWNGYRGVFEEEASRILGRDVRVGGDVNLRLLPTPYIRFEQLRIADVTGGSGEPLFRAETFTAWLSVPPLLRGNIEVRHMALEQPVVNLVLDAEGVGNWASLSVRTARLPFVPQNVALQSVDITEGSAILSGAAGEIVRLDAIDGELAAEALDGPFRFTGTATWDGLARELRIASGKATSEGELRFRAQARTKGENGTTAQLDGSLHAVAGKARLDGALSMKIPLPELPAAAASVAPPSAAAPDAPAGGNGKPAPPPGPVALDLKGRVAIDASRLEASQLVASIENVGQPQLVTGAAVLAWGEPSRLDFNVASHWLDLDRLAPSSGRASPIATLSAMARGVVRALPAGTGLQGTIGVEQLTLGGEAVGGLDVALAREKDGPIVIERFLAALPAGARIAIDGRMVAAPGSIDLDGRLTVAGPSLKRLVKWAAAGSPVGDIAPDGSFGLDAGLAIARDAIRLNDLRARLAGHAMTGAIALPLSSEAPLTAALEADTVETAWLWDGPLTRAGVTRLLERLARPGVSPAAGEAARGRDLDIRLRAGALHGPDRTLGDVDVALAVRAGVLSFERLSFRSGEALSVDLAGRLATAADAADGGGPGYLRGSIAAASPAAFAELVALLEIEPGERTRRLTALAPVRLAGNAKLGARVAGSLDARLEGVVGGGRVTLGVGFDRLPGAAPRAAEGAAGAAAEGAQSAWTEAPAEITIAASDAPVDELLALLTGRAVRDSAGSVPPGERLRANAALKAVGVPAAGMIVDSAITGPGLNLAYNGSAKLGPGGTTELGGTLEVAADRLGDVLAITGLSGSGNGLDQALTGTLGLASEADGTLKLTPSGLTIAGARIDGMLRVARAEQGRTRLGGEITVDRATVPGLLGGLVAGAPMPVPAAAARGERNAAPPASPRLWSEQPFASDAFQRLEGAVTVKVARLALASGLTLADARLLMAFAPSRITAGLDEAHGLGGAFTGELVLDKVAAGVRATGKLAANGIALARIAEQAGAAGAEGTAAASLSFSGQALSPAALVSSFEGAGTVTLSTAKVAGFAPQAVRATAEAAFARSFVVNETALLALLGENLAKGALPIGPRQIAIAIDDGALKLERLEVAAPGGRVEVLVTVDLATLDAESEWRITAAGDAPGRPDWPTIGVFYTGPLARLAGTEPRIALGSFERELTVRRMEREVEELERLRRLDEARARAERERAQALEAERQRQIEAERLRRQQPVQPQSGPASTAPTTAPPASTGTTTTGPGSTGSTGSTGAGGAALPGGGWTPSTRPATAGATGAGETVNTGTTATTGEPAAADGEANPNASGDLVAPPRPAARPRPARSAPPSAAEVFNNSLSPR